MYHSTPRLQNAIEAGHHARLENPHSATHKTKSSKKRHIEQQVIAIAQGTCDICYTAVLRRDYSTSQQILVSTK